MASGAGIWARPAGVGRGCDKPFAARAAARFAVSPSYVAKLRTRLRLTGEATPGPQRNHVPPRVAPLAEASRARVASGSDATLAESRAWVLAEHGVLVS